MKIIMNKEELRGCCKERSVEKEDPNTHSTMPDCKISKIGNLCLLYNKTSVVSMLWSRYPRRKQPYLNAFDLDTRQS